MPVFSNTVDALLADRLVRVAILLKADFASETVRWWLGPGNLRAGGQVWTGAGDLVSMSGLEAPIGGTAPQSTFTLSGVSPDLMAKALASENEVKDQPITVYLQFLDGAWQPLDAPYAVYSGVMDVMSVSLQGPASATISVTAESLFARRGMPFWGDLSDAHQQRLYPGDLGLERIAQIPFRTFIWPIITTSSK